MYFLTYFQHGGTKCIMQLYQFFFKNDSSRNAGKDIGNGSVDFFLKGFNQTKHESVPQESKTQTCISACCLASKMLRNLTKTARIH